MTLDEGLRKGEMLAAAGRAEEAMAAFRDCLGMDARNLEAMRGLTVLLAGAGRFGEAIAMARRAVEIAPQSADCHSNLGCVLVGAQRKDEGRAAFEAALAVAPEFVPALMNLGFLLAGEGKLDEAIGHYQAAARVEQSGGGTAAAHDHLGRLLCVQGRYAEAAAACRASLAIAPRNAETQFNLGNALWMLGDAVGAVKAYREALAIHPDFPEVLNNLGNILRRMKTLEEGPEIMFRRAVALRPDYAEAWNSLGCLLHDQGQMAAALEAYRRAPAANPNGTSAYSNALYSLHFDAGMDAARLLAEHREWSRRYAEPLRGQMGAWSNDGAPGRRLRVGYVSPDFHAHPVGRFMLPLLTAHDEAAVEVFCYADGVGGGAGGGDLVTALLRAKADVWRSIVGMTDEQVAALVRRDEIDVLVDLSAHSGNGRLLMFARKPAPVQVTYLGYCSTTGLAAMDYRLTDRFLDAPGGGDAGFYVERSVWLETYWCYQGPAEAPAVGALPLASRGLVTFGCLNNSAKMSDAALALWGRVMMACPDSRILLHVISAGQRERALAALEREGVERARCDTVGYLPKAAYFEAYGRIDVALDPIPFSGGTSTCDALWMGVPVVTLRGRTAVGRGGVSILSQIGLTECVAETEAEYVEKTAALARDAGRLVELRRTLRGRMLASALMDGPRFARDVERAYRGMWEAFCGASG